MHIHEWTSFHWARHPAHKGHIEGPAGAPGVAIFRPQKCDHFPPGSCYFFRNSWSRFPARKMGPPICFSTGAVPIFRPQKPDHRTELFWQKRAGPSPNLRGRKMATRGGPKGSFGGGQKASYICPIKAHMNFQSALKNT